MGRVIADMSVSLDGFVADPDDGVDRVFAWYGKPQLAPEESSSRTESGPGLGMIVYGRRTFDVAKGWGGRPSHRRSGHRGHPPTSGRLAARGLHGGLRDGKHRGGRGTSAADCRRKRRRPRQPVCDPAVSEPGLVDRIQLKVVPLLQSRGIRLFDNLTPTPLELHDPDITEGNGVTHLSYDVIRATR